MIPLRERAARDVYNIRDFVRSAIYPDDPERVDIEKKFEKPGDDQNWKVYCPFSPAPTQRGYVGDLGDGIFQPGIHPSGLFLQWSREENDFKAVSLTDGSGGRRAAVG